MMHGCGNCCIPRHPLNKDAGAPLEPAQRHPLPRIRRDAHIVIARVIGKVSHRASCCAGCGCVEWRVEPTRRPGGSMLGCNLQPIRPHMPHIAGDIVKVCGDLRYVDQASAVIAVDVATIEQQV